MPPRARSPSSSSSDSHRSSTRQKLYQFAPLFTDEDPEADLVLISLDGIAFALVRSTLKIHAPAFEAILPPAPHTTSSSSPSSSRYPSAAAGGEQSVNISELAVPFEVSLLSFFLVPFPSQRRFQQLLSMLTHNASLEKKGWTESTISSSSTDSLSFLSPALPPSHHPIQVPRPSTVPSQVPALQVLRRRQFIFVLQSKPIAKRRAHLPSSLPFTRLSSSKTFSI